jgi:DNA-binding MarR family transcriptional regulator
MNLDPTAHRAYFFKLDTTVKKIRQTLQKKFDEKKLDITVDQWTIIDHVYRHEGISQNSLAEMTAKDAPTVTRILDLLIKKGLAVRESAEFDRRKFCISLTPAGEKKYEKAEPIVVELRKKGVDALSEEEYADFLRMLNVIYKNMSKE